MMRHHSIKTRNNAGFTLIELMTVIAIIGILASTSISSYKSLIRNAQLLTAEIQLKVALQEFSLNLEYSPASGMLDELVTEGYLDAIPNDPWTDKVDPALTGAEEATDWYYENDGDYLYLYAMSHPGRLYIFPSFGSPTLLSPPTGTPPTGTPPTGTPPAGTPPAGTPPATMAEATKTANQMRQDAQQQAKQIRNDAKKQAQDVTKAADQQAQQMIKQAQAAAKGMPKAQANKLIKNAQAAAKQVQSAARKDANAIRAAANAAAKQTIKTANNAAKKLLRDTKNALK
ncbi:MAG: hypothetical protein CO186_05090 [Zetaproteobacteria bacterium CG_4_9_14_3_um_filter_49_83]|nr:MAG: hypothetical protein AUJ56_13310 [Zetaproteobacteria bacterium CG1_02_49_23]PIQ30542.1 MAG: hypothetical protein COW62_12100 [Zetaproteobacteria bacterium CG17_big_fil_post_rev_8_21_14_2_50_50_13]PIV30973.1 MAG: hypothetical protein COS35_03835 [Zetaproteobacteria bacterium CG02_land_8_20_14_3_00_50_9]PIY54912.1 MAG: hypothetical protein COZ00_12215 [Zetaproteobacteria bacterium CG_4_10_14_0_8_um_filter_49_80]PJA35593.1 MAG: hypothetical protein CO186_05090 [Zetaproteobacteria bacterium